MSLYLYQNDKQSGPFSEEEVRQKLQQGTVLPATLAWREGTADWMPLASCCNSLLLRRRRHRAGQCWASSRFPTAG